MRTVKGPPVCRLSDPLCAPRAVASRASTDGAGLQVLQTSADGSTSGAKKRAMLGKAITKKAHKRAKR